MEFLTVNETAQLLRVSPITVRRYIASGRLAAERVGRGIRVRREAIEAFITPVVAAANGSSEAALPWRDDGEDAELDEELGRPTRVDDPLWNIVGIGSSGEPNDVVKDQFECPSILEGLGISVGIGRAGAPTSIAEHKDEYIADAIEAKG